MRSCRLALCILAAADEFNRLEDGKKYFDLAKPEFQDLSPIFKLVKEVLPQK